MLVGVGMRSLLQVQRVRRHRLDWPLSVDGRARGGGVTSILINYDYWPPHAMAVGTIVIKESLVDGPKAGLWDLSMLTKRSRVPGSAVGLFPQRSKWPKKDPWTYWYSGRTISPRAPSE